MARQRQIEWVDWYREIGEAETHAALDAIGMRLKHAHRTTGVKHFEAIVEAGRQKRHQLGEMLTLDPEYQAIAKG